MVSVYLRNDDDSGSQAVLLALRCTCTPPASSHFAIHAAFAVSNVLYAHNIHLHVAWLPWFAVHSLHHLCQSLALQSHMLASLCTNCLQIMVCQIYIHVVLSSSIIHCLCIRQMFHVAEISVTSTLIC